MEKTLTPTNKFAVATYKDKNGNVIELDKETVDNYLVSGENKLTEKEYVLAMKLCEMQRLNPWTREVHIIKFGSTMQLVTSYGIYVRRAEESPAYRGHSSGIIVERQVGPDTFEEVYKDGSCIASRGEKLIGGWCKVKKQYAEFVGESLTTVSLSECIQRKKDGTPNEKWATSPCSMIEKVAVSRALKLHFESQYEGMCSDIEMETKSPNLTGTEVFESDYNGNNEGEPETEQGEGASEEDENRIISKEERAELFALPTPYFDTKGARNDFLQDIFIEYNKANGKEINSKTMSFGDYKKIMLIVNEQLEKMTPKSDA